MGSEPRVLILGDNIHFGQGLSAALSRADHRLTGATVFGYLVGDLERYVVVEFDDDGRALSIEDKPSAHGSNDAVTGLCFCDSRAPAYASEIELSAGGELEITTLNNIYLENGELTVEIVGCGLAWLDAGTHDSLIQANEFVQTIEMRQGLKIGCPEEVAYRQGFIYVEELLNLASPLAKSGYDEYLIRVADDHRAAPRVLPGKRRVHGGGLL